MTVIYLGPSPDAKHCLVFKINEATVTVARTSGKGPEFIRLNSDSASLLKEMLERLEEQLKSDTDISDFFKVGYITGLRLIDVCLHDEFIEYFKRQQLKFPHPNGKTQFEYFLNKIVGAKTHITYISYLKSFPYLSELYQVYETNLLTPSALQTLSEIHSFNGDISIEYGGFSDNHLFTIFIINGTEVLFPRRIKTIPHTVQELYNDCINAKQILINFEDITPFLEKYGAKCAYKILTIIGMDELCEYFKHVVSKNIENRLPFYPRKLMKEYGFHSILTSKEPFLLLDYLEQLEEELYTKYMESNDNEILRNDIWHLYFRDPEKIHWGRFDFTKFNPQIREEVLAFLRANYYISSCQHLLRLYYTLVEAIESLGSPTSILNIKLSDAIAFRAALTSNNKLSVTSISERIYCLASFYDFIALSNNLMKENPFRIARVKSHTQYLNPTNPISHEELRTVLKNLSLMSTHIQIAILILCETGARANEVCGITINEFHIESNGTPVLTINLRKNRKARAQRGSPTFVRHEISHNLAVLISDYIARHEAERSAINTDCILVYTPSQLRQGTQRPPVVLSSDTLKYWLDKLAGPDIQCTPRQIRAAIGRAAFATGKNASEVAAKLGNTAQIAETHYNFMLPQEEAELYDKFYDTIFQFNRLTPSMSRESFGHKELYGTCSNPNCSISNKNRCESCSQRFTCNPIPKEGAYIVS